MEDKQVDWKAVNERLQTGMTAFTQEVVIPLVTGIAEATQVITKGIMEVATKVHDAMYSAYLKDGAIYGESHEGMMRWMKERSEITRLRAEAERIEQHQWAIRDFKRQLQEKRSQE